VRLLQEAWSKVLMLTCLKHGVDSEEWQAALQTMDDLVWSVTPHEDPEARLRLLELVPGLLKALREGMASAAFDPFSTSEFFSQLEALHVQAFKRAAAEPEAAPDDSTTDAAQAGIELPLLELPVAEEAEPAPAMVEVVEEIVLLAPGQTHPQEPDVALPDDDEALQQVESLRVAAGSSSRKTMSTSCAASWRPSSSPQASTCSSIVPA